MALLAMVLPGWLRAFGADSHSVLFHTFFKVGALAITPLFFLKMIVFLVLLVFLSKVVQRVLITRVLTHLSLADSLKFAIGRFATYFLVLGGIFIGLQSLGVNLSSLVVFGGAVGVGVGLGLQNVVSNFVAGLILLIEQPIRLGDRVETGGTVGDVIRIAARSTWVRTNDNVVKIVPNNEFINNAVTNWTANDPNVRIHLAVGVGYSSDPEIVRTLLLAAAAEHPQVLKDPKPTVLFTDYGDNSINFDLLVWTSELSHLPLKLKSDLYFSLFKVFTETASNYPSHSAISISDHRTLRCRMRVPSLYPSAVPLSWRERIDALWSEECGRK
jgi:small-conductance mechanosensitive channel